VWSQTRSHGRVDNTGQTIYSGAKGGAIALTQSLAREMARYGQPLCVRRHRNVHFQHCSRDLLVVATTTSPDAHMGLNQLVIDGIRAPA